MSRTLKTRAPALTLALAVALTAACAPTAEPAAPVEPAPTVEPAAPVVAVEPTPEPDETIEPEPAPAPAGPVYTFEDGTTVEIDPEAETLPKKVRKDLAKRAGATASGDSVSAYANFIRDAQKTTGKKVIAVWRVKGQPEGKPEGLYWAISAVPAGIAPPVSTKDEAVAIAEAHVAAQDDPTEWVIVVSDQ